MTPAEQASHLIDCLGGCGKVAKALSRSPATVSNWKQRGVPWKYRNTMAVMALAQGVSVPQGFLGE
jgi:hypothetical protein